MSHSIIVVSGKIIRDKKRNVVTLKVSMGIVLPRLQNDAIWSLQRGKSRVMAYFWTYRILQIEYLLSFRLTYIALHFAFR